MNRRLEMKSNLILIAGGGGGSVREETFAPAVKTDYKSAAVMNEHKQQAQTCKAHPRTKIFTENTCWILEIQTHTQCGTKFYTELY